MLRLQRCIGLLSKSVFSLLAVAFLSNSALASDLGRGCVYLLNSFDPAKKGQWYDRRYYYEHHVGFSGNGTGYFPKTEMIQRDVATYFQAFFRLEQLDNPLLKEMKVTKESFCKKNDLTTFADRSKRKRDAYTGSAPEHCAQALAKACEDPTQLTSSPYVSPVLGKNNEFDQLLVELIDTEGRFKASIDEVLSARELLLRSFQFIMEAEPANALFEPVFSDLAMISEKSGILLERVHSLNQEADSKDRNSDHKTIELLRIFSNYFEDVTPLYKSVLKSLVQDLQAKISSLRAPNEMSKRPAYLIKLNQLFFSKVGQRVGRYTILLKSMKETLEKERRKLDSDQGEFAKQIEALLEETNRALASADRLAKSAI